MKRRTIILTVFIVFACKIVFSQIAETKAEILYHQAEIAYENKSYMDCQTALDNVTRLLGKTNAKVLYLYIKNADQGLILNASGLNWQLENLNQFFQLANKDTYPAEKYSEMKKIKLDIENKIDLLKKRKLLYDNLKVREVLFIRDTIDVYAQQFVNDFNNCIKHEPKDKYFPVKLQYNKDNHFISYNVGGREEHISLLGKITIDKEKEIEERRNIIIWYNYEKGKTAHLLYKDWQIKLNPFSTGTKFFNCASSLNKIIDLSNIMNSTGYSEYFCEDGFEDVKNI